jgi:hypothetical protein
MKDLKKLEADRQKLQKELIALAAKLTREVRKPVKRNGDEFRGGPDMVVMRDLAGRISAIVEFLAR